MLCANELTWWQLWKVGVAAGASRRMGAQGEAEHPHSKTPKFSAWIPGYLKVFEVWCLYTEYQWSAALSHWHGCSGGVAGVAAGALVGQGLILPTPHGHPAFSTEGGRIVCPRSLAVRLTSPQRFCCESVEQTQRVSQHGGGSSFYFFFYFLFHLPRQIAKQVSNL